MNLRSLASAARLEVAATASREAATNMSEAMGFKLNFSIEDAFTRLPGETSCETNCCSPPLVKVAQRQAVSA